MCNKLCDIRNKIVLALKYLIGYISFFSGVKCTKILIAGGRGHAKQWPRYILHLRGIFKRFCHGKINSTMLFEIIHYINWINICLLASRTQGNHEPQGACGCGGDCSKGFVCLRDIATDVQDSQEYLNGF